jgi:FHA domain
MGNYNGIRASTEICCNKGICVPQYEITFQEFEYRARITPSPVNHQEIFKSFMVDADSQLSSLDTSRQLKLEQAATNAQKLKLRVISSSTIKRGTEYFINALGCQNSKRPVKDGFTYAGVKKNIKLENGGKSIANDIVLPIDDKEIAEKHRGQHFCIYYELNKNCYCIRDLSIGFGTFAKVQDLLIIKDNYLLLMGEHYVLLNIILESQASKLKVKVFGPPCSDKIFYYSSDDYNQVDIRIGRAPGCDIQLEDSLASKVQSRIRYTKNKWVLSDGEDDKPSTNGVWLYLSEPLELVGGMILKSNHTIFQALVM